MNIFPITMPPLRERLDDIPLLVEFILKKLLNDWAKLLKSFLKGLWLSLQGYRSPGNIRELENVLERAVINSSGAKLRLVDELRKPVRDLASTGPKTMETVEREHILRVLELTKWKVSGKDSASEILGLDRSTLRARMSKLNIEKP